MIDLKTPNGLTVKVPVSSSEDISPKFALSEIEAARGYFDENGYVVFKGIFSREEAHMIMGLWDEEVKPSSNFMYRQATAMAEKHVFDENGWVMNPILNLQSVDPRKFPKFRKYAVEKILTKPELKKILEVFVGDTPKIVQSMYFEGNAATWEHQDSYYLDSEDVGKMVGVWIALEDISPTAGRFFICPKSHRLDLGRQDIYNNIADNHDVYIAEVVAKIKELGLEIRAPKLDQGDVLLWGAWTIHGSLDSSDPLKSRRSITCHVIAAKDKFLQLQKRVLDVSTDNVGGVEIHRPKDQARLRNRILLGIEGHFPNQFYWLKRTVIKNLFKKSA